MRALPWQGRPELANAFVQRPAEPPAKSEKWSALHEALTLCGTGSRDPEASLRIAQRLLAAGARVDAQATDGTTALHEAASQGNVHVLRLLLAGAGGVAALDALASGWSGAQRVARQPR